MWWTVERPPHNYLERTKESHQRGIIAPMCSAFGYGFKRSALRQHLSFTFKVNLCVDVGGVDRDVPHPGANGVDVDARAQEVGSGCMTDGVRADSFPQ